MRKKLALGTVIFSIFFSIFFYYFAWKYIDVASHSEEKFFFMIYLLIVWFFYVIYKWLQHISEIQKIELSAYTLLQIFTLQVFVSSCFFMGSSGENIFLWIIVFLKVLLLTLWVWLLWFVFYSFWATILRATKIMYLESKIFFILASLGLGFGVSMLGVFILAFAGLYAFWPIATWLEIIAIIWHKAGYKVLKQLKVPLRIYKLESHDPKNIGRNKVALMIDGINFLVIGFLISVNLINVYRPFPIWWDDLGAYMNYPKLLEQSWELLAFGQMYLWQLYTGLGFLVWNQTLAFYLSSFSGIIVAFVVYLWLQILSKTNQKNYFDIPLLMVVVLLSMPMTVFQLAKDMKLDYALLFISVITLVLVYWVLFTQNKFSHRKSLPVLGLIWFFIGIAFSIKVTSLLLLLWVLGMLCYKKFALLGFIWFLGIFFASFTYLELWPLMNVIFPQDNEVFVLSFSTISIIIWVLAFFIAYVKKEKGFIPISHMLGELWCIFVGFCVAVLPWGIKHFQEIPESVSISPTVISSWYAERYVADYGAIYTQTQLEKIEKTAGNSRGITSAWVTTNEDFGRYFGYEEGINNYLKLPWNLSFQVNQRGEFTDISFIFFALIPGIFLFFPYRKEIYRYPVVWTLLLLFLYYMPGPASYFLTGMFSSITLPWWYIVILIFFLFPFIYLYYTLDRSKPGIDIFLAGMSFTSVYVFLWAISSFGIVWYGIVMYFIFLLFITIATLYMQEKWGYISPYIVLATIWVYVFASSLPHWVNNLVGAWNIPYKLWQLSQEDAIMTSHPEYLSMLFELNIAPEFQDNVFLEYKNRLLKLISSTSESENLMNTIRGTKDIAELWFLIRELSQYQVTWLHTDAIWNIGQDLYEAIISVDPEQKNIRSIHRIGTFLKYYISENHKRIYEDSLLQNFDTYLYSWSPEVIVDRYKNLGISYILLDLNAATIDNDPSKNLTQRYENMLRFIAEWNLRMIETDSVCFKLALDEYKNTKNIEAYLKYAWVNYWRLGDKKSKISWCISKIIELIQSEKVNNNTYPYLLAYQNFIARQDNLDISNTQQMTIFLSRYVSHGFKALFEVSPSK